MKNFSKFVVKITALLVFLFLSVLIVDAVIPSDFTELSMKRLTLFIFIALALSFYSYFVYLLFRKPIYRYSYSIQYGDSGYYSYGTFESIEIINRDGMEEITVETIRMLNIEMNTDLDFRHVSKIDISLVGVRYEL